MRNWRIQTVFMMASASIPVLSFLLANHGIEPSDAGLESIKAVTKEVDSRAYVGLFTAFRIRESHEELQKLTEVKMASFCPNHSTSQWANDFDFTGTEVTVTAGLMETDTLVTNFLTTATHVLSEVTEVTQNVKNTVDWWQEKDWIVKLILVGLNVINGFFLLAVFLTKNNVDYPTLQAMISYLLLPLFCLVAIAAIAITCIFAGTASANAGEYILMFLP